MKTCPFCDGRARTDKSGGGDERCGYNFTAFVECSDCGARVTVGSKHDKLGWCTESAEAAGKRAALLWNKRT